MKLFRRVTYGVLGAAALAASVLLIRSQKEASSDMIDEVPAGEEIPGQVRLDRLRELGI